MTRLTASVLLALSLGMTACGTTLPKDSPALMGQPLAGGLGTTGALEIPGQPPAAGQPIGEVGIPGGAAGATPGSAAAGTTAGGTAAGGTAGGGPAPGGTAAGGTAAGGTDASAGGSTTSAAGPPAARPQGAAASAAAVPSGPQGRGVTATTLTIGAAIPEGAEAAGEAFGISGAGTVVEEDIWDAVIADVNASGGTLGRKLTLRNHPVNVASYIANPQQTFGEVCADFRDDNKVFAAFVYVVDPALRSCFAKMGSPFVVYGAFSTVPEAAFRENGGNYLYAPSGPSHEKLAQLFVQSLLDNKFTEKWDTVNGGPGAAPLKLGLIHADTPDQNNLYGAYRRELAKSGLKFSDTVTFSGNASDALASTSAAVLRFKANGVTHVFGASAFFLRDAENQRYRPRYAYLPGLGALGVANAPAEQLEGAQTVGWAPTQDVLQAQDPGPTAGAKRCDAVMRAAGILAQGNRQNVKLMYAVCDAVYSFDAGMEAGGEASVAGMRRGYESLTTGFPSAITFNTVLSPDRHYGVSSVRDMAFDSACRCLVYTSRTNRS